MAASVAAGAARQPHLVRLIALAWLAAAALSTAIALIQYFGQSAHFAPWVSASEVGEAFANLRQRNQFATLSSIGLATLLWRVQQGARLFGSCPQWSCSLPPPARVE
jgi:hypothetical protein